MAAFEIWEMRSGNLMGSYGSEAEALAVVADAIQTHGAGYAETLALVRENGRGHSETIAMGSELAEQAAAAGVKRRAVSA